MRGNLHLVFIRIAGSPPGAVRFVERGFIPPDPYGFFPGVRRRGRRGQQPGGKHQAQQKTRNPSDTPAQVFVGDL